MSKIDTRENAEAVAAYLNEMLRIAPEATLALCLHAVPIGGDAADAVPAVCGGEADAPVLRVIGLLNGLFSADHGLAEVYEGEPPVLRRFVAGSYADGRFTPFDAP